MPNNRPNARARGRNARRETVEVQGCKVVHHDPFVWVMEASVAPPGEVETYRLYMNRPSEPAVLVCELELDSAEAHEFITAFKSWWTRGTCDPTTNVKVLKTPAYFILFVDTDPDSDSESVDSEAEKEQRAGFKDYYIFVRRPATSSFTPFLCEGTGRTRDALAEVTGVVPSSDALSIAAREEATPEDAADASAGVGTSE